MEVPGKDYTEKIASVLPDDLAGKSILDIGCYYGLYSHEAKKHGAARVVGVEMNPERFKAATKISEFIGDGVEIIQGDITNIELDEKFDLILMLSVFQHLKDPVRVMEKLACLSKGTVVVEFALPTHQLIRKNHSKAPKSIIGKTVARIQHGIQQQMIAFLSGRLGLILTGEVFGPDEKRYDRTYFFNPLAF